MKSSYRWVIVACGALMTCVGIGAMFSLAIYLQPMSVDTGWSRTGISSAMTLDFLVMGAAGFGWGALSDRFGPRMVVLMGAVLLGLGLVLASGATSLLQFQLTYGLMVGLAAGAFFAPMIATVTGWFTDNRSLAVSLVSAGMGVAPMTMSPFAAWLISGHDWRTSLQIIAVVVAVAMLPTALLIRRPPALDVDNPPASAGQEPQSGMGLGQALRSPQFVILLLTNFFCCATHSGPIFHTVSYAVSCGIPLISAVSIYSMEGLAGMGGRIAFGLLGDRFGAKRVLVSGLLLQAFGALGYFAAAAVFGFIYAGVMPLYSVLARENFPLRMMGTIIGGTSMAGGLGMATGPLAGGLIYDTFATYSWLYLGAFGIGIGAFLIAMTFRPFPKFQQPGLASEGRGLASPAPAGG
jgi:MFS family permease